MKEVRCNGVEQCTRQMEVVSGRHPHWCHAATPHQVTEQCERSYCMEVRRQVQCKPVPEHGPPDTCTRRTRDLCDLSGMPCPIVYDGVTCRRGRPPSPAEVAEADVEERRYEDARQVWAESQGADDLGELRALAHDRDMAQRKVWHAFGHRTYRGIPVVKSDNLVPEAPDTMAPAVHEQSVHAIVIEESNAKRAYGFDQAALAERIAARIVALPRVEADATDTMRQAFRSKKMAVIIREAIDALHDGTKTPAGHIRRAVDRIIALPKWTPRIRQEGGE